MKVLLFGVTREIIGTAQLELPQRASSVLASVDDLREFLYDEYPELKRLSSLAIAVNNEYAQEHTALREEDEIALIPPVSGG